MTDDDVLIDEKLPRMPLKTQTIKTKCDECEKLVRYVRVSESLVETLRILREQRSQDYFAFSFLISEIERVYQALNDETRKAIEDDRQKAPERD